jgi:hypothetical protein
MIGKLITPSSFGLFLSACQMLDGDRGCSVVVPENRCEELST